MTTQATLARPVLGLALLATLLAGACPGRGPRSSDSPTWNVRFSHALSTGSEVHLMAERFRDLMHKRTGTGALGPANFELRQTCRRRHAIPAA